MSRPIPKDQESPFERHELFFSRTDSHGVIRSGNRVFLRVSGYGASEMAGVPHNIIRHPDMPKAVFRYFWETISSGRPIAAYVKNMAKDGRYYWVLATVFPVPGGYVSVRMKPGGALFQAAQKLYREVLGIESRQGVEASYRHLLGQVQALGFASYRAFALRALMEEFESRDASPELVDAACAENSPCSKASKIYQGIFGELKAVSDLGASLLEESRKVSSFYKGIYFLPVNMAVASEHSGEKGRTLTVISETFGRWAADADRMLQEFATAMGEALERLEGASFNVAASRLLVNMMNAFVGELKEVGAERGDASGSLAMEDELRIFDRTVASIFRSLESDVDALLESLSALRRRVDLLKETMGALYLVHQSGRMEVAHLGKEGEAFAQHLRPIGDFVHSIGKCIAVIEEVSANSFSKMTDVKNGIREVRKAFQGISGRNESAA